MFHIGQEVVCVDAKDMGLLRREKGPKAGNKYTIRGFKKYGAEVGIYLEEIINPPTLFLEGWHEPSFYDWRFRPVQKKSTDISSLVALLNPVNHKKLEDV